MTVLFTDVSGFTAMSERLDPEDVHAIMDQAFEIILEAVHRYEGTINQFLGDGVMALFGAPIAHEDHAHRALAAALAIQEGLGPLRDDVRRTHDVEFRVRIGINTGLVVVGAIGRDLRMDYTAVGDTTNLAARMLNLAQPGQIVTTAPTQRLTDGFFLFEDLGDFTVKGKSDPVRAYAVTAEIRGRTRLEVSRVRGLTPLRGRAAELARLRAAYERAAGGRGGVLLITGDPGVGKSRLLYEFLRGLQGAGRHRELEASCVSYGRSIPYHPIVELIRRDVGLLDGVDDAAVREACATRLRQLGLDVDQDATTLLAHLLGVGAPQDVLMRLGAQLKVRTMALICELFVHASAAEPLVVIVENVHWSDPSSEELLKTLIPLAPDNALLLVLTTRPEAVDAWTSPSVERLHLAGLGVEEAAGMIATVLGATSVARPLLDALAAKSEGNPLYVEEILRQLNETGGIVVESGEARLSRPDVAVPSTVHDIIAARVDRLDEPAKQTLQGASVVGRQFLATLLARLFAAEEPRIVGHLAQLQAREFVFLLEQLLYSFKHALTQEVVYSGMLERRRRQYHAGVGAGLEELYASNLDEVVELLAYHYGRSAEAEKAVDYAIRAGEKAQRRWASAEALVHFQAALKRLESMNDSEPNQLRRIDAVVKQSEIMFALGRHAEQVQALEKIKNIVEAVGDPPRQAAWYSWAGFLHSLTGAPPQRSIGYCHAAWKTADAGGFEHLRAFADCSLSHVYLAVGNLAGALEAGERALSLFEERGDTWWACRSLWALSPVANALGQWSRGLEYCRRALEHGRSLNDLRMKVVGWWRTGSTHVQRGDPEAALACCEEAQRLGPIPFDAAMIKTVRGYSLVKSGVIDAGLADLTDAVDWFERSGLRYTRSLVTMWLVESRLRTGRRDGLDDVLRDVLQTATTDGYRHLEGIAHRLLGEWLLADDHPEAAGHLDAATTIFREVGARNEEGKTLIARAELRRSERDVEQARDLLVLAHAIFGELGTRDELQRAAAILETLPR
ncbi:MAG TPA: adenylate/guanylate cyclase domain-containing protein [Methylomirabilota bacterium]